MDVMRFVSALEELGADFYAGVPDSLLSPFVDFIVDKYGISSRHIVAANEGAAVGLAAGHYLATSAPAVVYMQNSGIGNAVNPICSLLHTDVYAIPVVFVIGWRGEPGTKDEPQHVFQGKSTLEMLDCLEIPYVIISKETDDNALSLSVDVFKGHISNGQSVAFVVCKDSLSNDKKTDKKTSYIPAAKMSREHALDIVLQESGGDDVFICTTGKLSREVFELREQKGMGHGHDFLTVGSMGHSSMIAYGIALARPDKRVFCLDGDGAVLMHMGSLAVIGANNPKNLVHIVMNNGAHETVGGVPAVSVGLNLCNIALSMGYRHSYRVTEVCELLNVLDMVRKSDGAVFVEIMCNLKSRADLGRPTTSPVENKFVFMGFLC